MRVLSRSQSIEADQVFDARRAGVGDTEDLSQEPVGVRGLAEVARQHPFLQRPLLSFVQDLPVSKLGPWVVIGWASAFSETDVASDFAATLKGWADQDDNKQLKAAAAAAMKRSEEHTSELQSLMRISYAVFCLKKKIKNNNKAKTQDK